MEMLVGSGGGAESHSKCIPRCRPAAETVMQRDRSAKGRGTGSANLSPASPQDISNDAVRPLQIENNLGGRQPAGAEEEIWLPPTRIPDSELSPNPNAG
jgi:hypothetical protein